MPNPAEQVGLHVIHDMDAAGHSSREIAEELARQGIATRRGGPWTAMVVARILRPQWVTSSDFLAKRCKRHGITVEKYNEMLQAQHHTCASCGLDDRSHGRDWVIDHDHTCCPGQSTCGSCIRGLLCDRCNMGIGYFKDSPSRLRAAANYLERF